jgi:hypothetical protein
LDFEAENPKVEFKFHTMWINMRILLVQSLIDPKPGSIFNSAL